jgi:exopolysaccharide biosynthesis polyprenyl glycosylphosphotransferase
MSTTHITNPAPLGLVIPFPLETGQRADKQARWMRHFDAVVPILERTADFFATGIAVFTACRLSSHWNAWNTNTISANQMGVAVALCGLLMVLLLDKHGDYRPCLSLLAVRETERLLRVTLIGLLLALPMLVGMTRSVPTFAVGAAVVLVPIALAVEKWLLQKLFHGARSAGGLTRKAVIVGTGQSARRVFSALVRSPKLGIEPVAFIDVRCAANDAVIFESSYIRRYQARVLHEPVTPRLLRRLGASIVVIADSNIGGHEAAMIGHDNPAKGVSVYVLSGSPADDDDVTEYVELDGLLLACQVKPRERAWFASAKRVLDVAVAAISLMVLSPLMLVAALGINTTSHGPIIFRQKRVGRYGKQFEMYKFRTMYVGSAQYARSPVTGDDPRITPFGKFLRRTCIDELPQLFNVLRGDMSLVGPRPEMPFIVEEYEALHRKRLEVKPGITGLWQLSADRQAPIHENISYDLYYVRHRNLFMDLAILLHTAVFAFRGV